MHLKCKVLCYWNFDYWALYLRLNVLRNGCSKTLKRCGIKIFVIFEYCHQYKHLTNSFDRMIKIGISRLWLAKNGNTHSNINKKSNINTLLHRTVACVISFHVLQTREQLTRSWRSTKRNILTATCFGSNDTWSIFSPSINVGSIISPRSIF